MNSRPRTHSRALQLALYDINEKGKPTDEEIAKEWGLANPRSVRDIRATDEYELIVSELQQTSLQYAAARISKIAGQALDELEGLLPTLVTAAYDLLTPVAIQGGGTAPLNPQAASAGNSIVRTLIELSNIKQISKVTPRDEAPAQVMTNLVLAKSETHVVKEYRASMEMPDIVDGDFQVTTPAQESEGVNPD